MNDYIEKRDFYRMVVDGEVKFRIEGESLVSTAKVMNLSNSGLLMAADREIPTGTKITLAIIPGQAITPPLYADALVIRCDNADDGQFHVASTIERILAESDTGPDFP
jgi:hypothetical protein